MIVQDLCSEIVVQCVYGEADVSHISNVLLPSLLQATRGKVHLVCLNFRGSSKIENSSPFESRIRISAFTKPIDVEAGFAANHNQLFEVAGKNKDYFVIVNPDCILAEGSLDILVDTYEKAKGSAAIVEGRQWPFEHPKEFNTVNKETPWASGAFSLIDSRFYKEIGGMDENYFLYTEDVDLSWRAWLSGRKVLYERDAVVTHFTGGPFYRDDTLALENYFSLRNFIYISRKFFGKPGEAAALRQLGLVLEKRMFEEIRAAYMKMLGNLKEVPSIENRGHTMIKITGVNLFHEVNK